MSSELWIFDDLVRAAGGTADGTPERPVTGFSIDTRTLRAGEVFAALKDQRDGHAFVTRAFEAGASAALVARDYERKAGEGALIRVDETLLGLEAIGRAARRQLAPEARVVAVTGSVGKTGTKDMLRTALARLAPTHAPTKSYNNHWGVPLTLAGMPAATAFGVFEIGMNHPGEITPLASMVRPHVAIVTTVEPVHLAFFPSVAAIAEAKAEIFLGLEPGGVAVLNRDNPHFDLLAERAKAAGARIVSFGLGAAGDVRALHLDLAPEGSNVTASVHGREIHYRLGAPGAHIVQNSLAVVAALESLHVDLELALPALAEIGPAPGRGARSLIRAGAGHILLIDESYNANPASMRAALENLGGVPRERYPRRIAVLGEMLELGAEAERLHAGLKEAVDRSGADLVFACGPNMAHLYAALPAPRRGAWAETSDGLKEALVAAVAPGDAVMVKGSLGSRMAPLVEALKARFAPAGIEA
jgi:UDP-N-acetylmuramoyl-tripeptide--D-alanyl-D-alanine ligase